MNMTKEEEKVSKLGRKKKKKRPEKKKREGKANKRKTEQPMSVAKYQVV